MPTWLTPEEYATLTAVCDVLIPADQTPGAADAGVVEYIDGFLGAFSFDPPGSGPAVRSPAVGAVPRLPRFHRLSALDELAWRTRIEGSQGLPEREFNGAVVGSKRDTGRGSPPSGLISVPATLDEQYRRLREHAPFTKLVYEHCCEGMYGAPEYGGNRDGIGWSSIGVAGDVQPRGWSDAEVSEP